jgi:hypothetical protein
MGVSYRAGMMQQRSVNVDLSTIVRSDQRYAPENENGVMPIGPSMFQLDWPLFQSRFSYLIAQ